MKIWYHIIAAIVGLAVAALIVYIVFGSASQQGAVQDGDAGSLSAGADDLCGSITPAKATSPAARTKAAKNLPALFDQLGPIPAISDKQPDQQDWVARVHAAGGLCLDELRIEPEGTTISMSTVDGVSSADAAAFAAGAITQAFTKPFSPRRVTLEATVDGKERTIIVSDRAWRAFQIRRRQLGLENTVENLKLFRQASSFSAGDLRVVGW